MENSSEQIPLTVRAIDLVIADFEGRTHAERDEQLELLHNLRTKLLAEARGDVTPIKHSTERD
jgi:hypothetical protein